MQRFHQKHKYFWNSTAPEEVVPHVLDLVTTPLFNFLLHQTDPLYFSAKESIQYVAISLHWTLDRKTSTAYPILLSLYHYRENL